MMPKGKMIRMMGRIFPVLLLTAALPVVAVAADWELFITASTSTSAKNDISLGQKAGATDGFDGYYDVPAYVEGGISAYFPHEDWNQEAVKYWRDIKGPGPQKSWIFNIESSDAMITISWETSNLPEGYTAILLDTSTDISVDMTAQGIYSYSNTGTRQFTVETAGPPDATPPSTTASPSGGSYASARNLTLLCDDGSGSGCDATWYCLGTGCSPATVYSGAIDISSSTDLRFYSNDAAGNSETIKTESYTIIDPLCYTAGDTGSGGNDNIAGISRSDGGDDSNNLSGGKAKVDLEYAFSIIFMDDSGEDPVLQPKLYLAHRSSPTEGAGGDFFVYDTTCTGAAWGAGKTCTVTLKLGPAAAHNYYFKATKSDGTPVRLPSSGYSAGPSVKSISGYAMVSAPRDVDSANLAGNTAFGRTTYRWVSTGLDPAYNTTFSGYWEAVTASNPVRKGEAYFTSGASSTLPELSGYSDNSDSSDTITLQPGWNMIGNHYNGNVKLGDVTVRKGSGAEEPWLTAASKNWVYNTLWYYNGSDWGGTWGSEFAGGSPDAELVPWIGYYIYLRVDDDTYSLTIPKPAQ